MAPQSPLHGITVLAFILHIGGGALHGRAGTIFVVSMLVMSVLAIYLAVAEPKQLTNVCIGSFANYLVGFMPQLNSAVPFKGPVLVAFYSFTSIIVLAAIGAPSGVSPISRHLWRMCLGLTLAAGSGFTNGFARLLPGPYHVPTGFFLPQFLPLGLLVFWMIRVGSKGWRQSLVEVNSGRNHPRGVPETRYS